MIGKLVVVPARVRPAAWWNPEHAVATVVSREGDGTYSLECADGTVFYGVREQELQIFTASSE